MTYQNDDASATLEKINKNFVTWMWSSSPLFRALMFNDEMNVHSLKKKDVYQKILEMSLGL